jgi:hypothetical protein
MPAALRKAPPMSVPLPQAHNPEPPKIAALPCPGAATRWSLAATHAAGWLLAEADGGRLDREGRYRCAG